MIKKFASRISAGESITERKEEIEYGLYCIFLFAVNLSGLLALAYLLSVLPYILIVLFGVGTLKSLTGGPHLRSPFVCFVATAVFYFSVVFFALYFPLKPFTLIILYILSIFIIWKFAPVDAPEKPILKKEHRHQLKALSLFWLFLCFVAALFLPLVMINVIIIGCFAQSLTIVLEVYRRGGVNK